VFHLPKMLHYLFFSPKVVKISCWMNCFFPPENSIVEVPLATMFLKSKKKIAAKKVLRTAPVEGYTSWSDHDLRDQIMIWSWSGSPNTPEKRSSRDQHGDLVIRICTFVPVKEWTEYIKNGVVAHETSGRRFTNQFHGHGPRLVIRMYNSHTTCKKIISPWSGEMIFLQVVKALSRLGPSASLIEAQIPAGSISISNWVRRQNILREVYFLFFVQQFHFLQENILLDIMYRFSL